MNFAVTVTLMEIPITLCLPFFVRADGNFYLMILSHKQGRGPNESLIKNSNKIRTKALKNDLRVSSKGDNFDVKQL